MYDGGSTCVSAVLSDQADEIETVPDGAVGVWPAGGTVLAHLQHGIALDGARQGKKG